MGPRDLVYAQYKATCSVLARPTSTMAFRLRVLYDFRVLPDTLEDGETVMARESRHDVDPVLALIHAMADFVRERGHYSVHGIGSRGW